MEAFSLLKYWRGGGGGGGGGGGDSTCSSRAATTIVTAVAQNTNETDDDDDGDDNNDDDGPFFDLEFAVPDEEEEEDGVDKKETNNGVCFEEENGDIESDDDDDGEGSDGEREFKFTLSSDSSNDRVDQNLPLSPSDDLFFKGRLVPIEPSSLVINGGSESNSKPHFPVSFLKSATKFRVFLLGFKKSITNVTEKANEKNGEASESATSPKQKQEEKGEEVTKQSKFFTVKFKVEEVPIMSLFTRENSKNTKSSQKQSSNTEEAAAAAAPAPTSSTSDEKRFSKEVMQKYLKKVKPLYIRVSKRYGEKLRFSGQLSLGSGLKAASAPPPKAPTVATAQKSSPSVEKSQPEMESTETDSVSNVKSLKQGSLPAGLRVACKHLGKSRSASSAVAAAPSAPVISRRRDDSLLQQQDGIQSAILHCKRSFNAARDSDSSLLSRSVSDPSNEKSLEFSSKSSDGGKLITNKNGS